MILEILLIIGSSVIVLFLNAGDRKRIPVTIAMLCLLALLLVLVIYGNLQRLSQYRKIRYLLLQKDKEQIADTEKTREMLHRRIELTTLQSQINPHFLYNTLDSIRGEALENGQPQIAKMTEKLSRFFRYCISGQETLATLQDELQHVQDYFYIQKYRFEDRVNLDIQVEEDDLYECYLPKISLQPIVENAVAHGLEDFDGKGLVSIRVKKTESRLYIRIADNGVGMEPEQLKRLNEQLRDGQVKVHLTGTPKHTGIAIKNVNSRIRISFGEQFGLHYRSILGEGTEAEMILPLIDDYNRLTYEKQFAETYH